VSLAANDTKWFSVELKVKVGVTSLTVPLLTDSVSCSDLVNLVSGRQVVLYCAAKATYRPLSPDLDVASVPNR
jgi:hypothetical protein